MTSPKNPSLINQTACSWLFLPSYDTFSLVIIFDHFRNAEKADKIKGTRLNNYLLDSCGSLFRSTYFPAILPNAPHAKACLSTQCSKNANSSQ